MQHFVYIIYSETRDQYYIGNCADLDVRLNRHNAGATPSAKNGQPWKIIFNEDYYSKTEALKSEICLKRMKSLIY